MCKSFVFFCTRSSLLVNTRYWPKNKIINWWKMNLDSVHHFSEWPLNRNAPKMYNLYSPKRIDSHPGKCHIYNRLVISLQATVLCDIVVLYVLQKKYFYREKKYLFVEDSDSESGSEGNRVIWNLLLTILSYTWVQ